MNNKKNQHKINLLCDINMITQIPIIFLNKITFVYPII